jgi:hypothetical protein
MGWAMLFVAVSLLALGRTALPGDIRHGDVVLLHTPGGKLCLPTDVYPQAKRSRLHQQQRAGDETGSGCHGRIQHIRARWKSLSAKLPNP